MKEIKQKKDLMKDLLIFAKFFSIAFLGSVATYYSAIYLTPLDLSFSDIEYWIPLFSAIITLYLYFSEALKIPN